MSFLITRGLAEFDCPDHYAVLGVAIDASAGEVRKRYMRIVKNLHPDRCGPDIDKAQASQVLSKLVNPAYEVLSQDKQREEYTVLLRLVGQRASLEKQRGAFEGEQAQALLEASDYATLYQQTVNQLAQEQYQSLDHITDVVSQLSEVNLAYLLRREGKPQSKPSPSKFQSTPAVSTQASSTVETSVTVPPKPPPEPKKPPSNQYVDEYCRRAQELINKNAFPQAIQELRDGLKLDPQSSRCHSLLGTTYLKQDKATMAKVHFSQALKLNPKDPDAVKGMASVEKLLKKQKATATPASKASIERKGPFGLGSLFGGKKK